MAFDLYNLLSNGTEFPSMPAVPIKKRGTDKKILYNKNLIRLDRISGDLYGDETYWRLILWANPEYYIEFDIPDNTVIRVPYPLNEVIKEVTEKIIEQSNG